MSAAQEAKKDANKFEKAFLQQTASGSEPPLRVKCETQTGHLGSTNPGPLSIALVDHHVFTRECVTTCLQTLCADARIVAFANIAECIAAGPDTFDVIFFYLRNACGQGLSTEASVSTLSHELHPAALVVVSDSEDPKAGLDALSAGARGFIPSLSMSPTLTIEVIRLVRAGGTFAPVNIPLMRQASEQARDHLDPPSNQFTPRQLLVLEHLQRGSANKIIAHELALSEGTVKVHVRNIMKKLRATNRTQAVSRSYKLMSGGEVAEVTARAAWRAPEVGQATSP